MSFLTHLPEELYRRDAFARFETSGFGIGTAGSLAWLSQLAYETDQGQIERILNAWGLGLVAVFRRAAVSLLPLASTKGLVAEGQGTVFLAFGGTDPLTAANWITDFNFLPGPDGTSRGFETALDAAWDDVGTNLRGALSGQSRVFVAGHSLGAALAALAARRILRERNVQADGVYVFGMPRIGGVEFARGYDQDLGERTYRFVYGDDIVATVPPSNLGYRHVGRLLKCVRRGRFDPDLLQAVASDDPAFAPELLRALKDGFGDFVSGNVPAPGRGDLLGRLSGFLPPPIADHLPDRYCAALI